MVDVEQGVGVPSGIEEKPYLIRPTGGTHEFYLETAIVPSSISGVRTYVMSCLEIEFGSDFPEYERAARILMKDIDNLKDGVSLLDEPDLSDEAFFISDHKEIKRPAWEPRNYAMSSAGINFKWIAPKIGLPYFFFGRTGMKVYDKGKKELSLYDESAGSIYDGEFKSISTMRANGMSLAITPTPITGRYATSEENCDVLLDSGASEHVTCNRKMLRNLRDPPPGTSQFVGADGSPMDVSGYGDLITENFKIPGVYLVQRLIVNLISVGRLASDHKVCCCFAGNECNLMLPDGRRIGGAIRRDDNQYLLRFLEIE